MTVTGPASGQAVLGADAILVARLRDGDEHAFDEAVTSLFPAMLAVARGYVGVRSVAEEVVQEAWIAVLKGIDRFEGRSTLRTWVLRIVANIARDRAVREARSLPFSSLETRRRAGGRTGPVSRFRRAVSRRLEVLSDRLANSA